MLRITALGLAIVMVIISLLACTGVADNANTLKTNQETNGAYKISDEFAQKKSAE